MTSNDNTAAPSNVVVSVLSPGKELPGFSTSAPIVLVCCPADCSRIWYKMSQRDTLVHLFAGGWVYSVRATMLTAAASPFSYPRRAVSSGVCLGFFSCCACDYVHLRCIVVSQMSANQTWLHVYRGSTHNDIWMNGAACQCVYLLPSSLWANVEILYETWPCVHVSVMYHHEHAGVMTMMDETNV